MKQHNYLFVEPPDKMVKVDFANQCSVILEVVADKDSAKKLWVRAYGCDDRTTILVNDEYDLPEPDLRT